MNSMLDDRLLSIVKYVDKCDNIIDIGCDHALLDIYLVKNKIVDSIIISDISLNALNQGINNIKKYNLDEFIEARCGNGMSVLNDNDIVDTVIISGMGSNTIIDILDNDYIKNIKKLIIQSNRDYYLLRKYLTNNGFYISNEEALSVNDKIYITIVFKRGFKEYSENELLYGTFDMVNKNTYYNYLIDKNNKLLKIINDIDRIEELNKENEYLKSIL